MMAQFYEAIILGRNADIQKGRKGQSLKQSLDEVSEDFKNPIVPYIENYDEVQEMLTPVMFQIHGNSKTKPALVRSLFILSCSWHETRILELGLLRLPFPTTLH